MPAANAQIPEIEARRKTPHSLLFGCNMVANAHILHHPVGYDESVYQTLKYLGAGFVRLCASPREIEAVRGKRNWRDFEKGLDLALEYGMEPMVLICNTPLWALPPEIETLPEGMDPTYQYPYRTDLFPEFADFCRELAERTRGKVRLFQLWNEQNGCSWHFHDGYNHADEYMPFLAVTYPAIKEGNPEALLLLGSLDDADGYAHIFMNMVYEIRDKDYPGQRLFDGVTLHPYDKDIENMERKLRRAYEIMKKNGDGDQPIFVTEYGWRTGVEGDPRKVEWLRETLEMFQKPDLDFLKGCIHLSLSDFEGEPGFGLTDENLRPRESFNVFQGTPRFGACPPHTICWMPVGRGEMEVSWKTVLPAASSLRWRNNGERGILESPVGTEHRVTVEDLEPGSELGFTLETVTEGKEKGFETAPYTARVPGPEVSNGDFSEAFFGGIAKGWTIKGPALCTDAAVFPGIEMVPGQHGQVLFAVPQRDISLDGTAHTWVTAETGKTCRMNLQALDASQDVEARVQIRVGLHPAGGRDANSASWSAWRTLSRSWEPIEFSAAAEGELITLFVQTRGEYEKKGRPAAAFSRVGFEMR